MARAGRERGLRQYVAPQVTWRGEPMLQQSLVDQACGSILAAHAKRTTDGSRCAYGGGGGAGRSQLLPDAAIFKAGQRLARCHLLRWTVQAPNQDEF